jgi:hypothetical protein
MFAISKAAYLIKLVQGVQLYLALPVSKGSLLKLTLYLVDDNPGIRPVRSAPTRPPGPPQTPAPASQPRHRPSVRVHRKEDPAGSGYPQIGKLKKERDEQIYFRQQGLSQVPGL